MPGNPKGIMLSEPESWALYGVLLSGLQIKDDARIIVGYDPAFTPTQETVANQLALLKKLYNAYRHPAVPEYTGP